MSQQKSRVKAQRDVNVFADLSHGNYVLLENAKEKRPGYHYEVLSCVVMSAFKFEAFLNHLGAIVIPYWSSLDRLPHKDKLTILAVHLGVGIDRGKRPFQTLSELFRARDGIAHGKPDSIKIDEVIEGMPHGARVERPETVWEKLITLEFAILACEDTEAIALQLWTAAKLDRYLLKSNGFSYSVESLP